MKFEDIDPADTRPTTQLAPKLAELFGTPAQRKTWKNYWVRDTLQGSANYLAHFALRLLPNTWASACGARLGQLAQARFRNGPFANRVARNADCLRPDITDDPQTKQQFLQQWWQNHGRVYAEFSVIDRLGQAPYLQLIGLEHLDAARASGRTVILPSVHLAAWEIFANLNRNCLAKTFGVFQQQGDRFTNRIVEHVRKRTGVIAFTPSLHTTKVIRQLLVSREASLLMFIDEVRDQQVHMPLFGRPAPDKGNIINILKLTKTSNALLVPIYAKRIGKCHFQVIFNKPMDVSQLPVNEAINTINHFFEPIVRADLEHWYMLGELRI